MPTRWNTKRTANDPEALAALLPDELRSFDAWLYGSDASGLSDYLAALAAQVAPHEPLPVMNAAGLSAAQWYRTMMSK